jgi:hypothetical protein
MMALPTLDTTCIDTADALVELSGAVLFQVSISIYIYIYIYPYLHRYIYIYIGIPFFAQVF